MGAEVFIKDGGSYLPGSCVVCGRGTDTGIAYRGSSEFLIAGLKRLGLPDSDAYGTAERATGADPGKVIVGVHTVLVRVCGSCADKAGPVKPGLMVEGGPLPMYDEKAMFGSYLDEDEDEGS